MTAGGFDTEATFNEDYLWFYEPTLTAQRSRREVDEIISTLGITEPAVILDAACGHGRIS
ncbi:MAG: class I SAM-dependent methyltransferase, partial [Actinomycetia bacterium]|nr:class I SAM-dependent methyltransferase [Actinomycetes bacterium]